MKKGRGFQSAISVLLLSTFLTSCLLTPSARKQKYYDSGMKYFEKGNYQAAEIQFRNAVRIDERFAEAHHKLAEVYMRLSLRNSAYQELVKTVDLQPRNWEAQIELGNLLLAQQQAQQALDKAQWVLSQNPRNPDAYVLLAESDAALGNTEKALAEITQAIEISPNRPELYESLALLQINAEQIPEAEASLEKAVSLNSKSARRHLALGAFYIQQRRFLDAEKQFKSAIEVEPRNPKPRQLLVALFLAQGELLKAEQVAGDLKREIGEDAIGCRMLGDYYLETGQVDKALGEFASLTEQHPKDLKLKGTLVQLLIQKNRLDQARMMDKEILRVMPRDPNALAFKGHILMLEKRTGEAVLLLQSLLKDNPADALAHYELGLAHAQQGDTNRAVAEWRETARLKPYLIDAQLALASASIRLGNVGQLAKSAEALIVAQPLSAVGYVYRAAVLDKQGDVSGAEKALRDAIRVAPQNALGYSRLATLRVSQNKPVEAERLYEEALRYNPNFIEALEGLVRIYLRQGSPQRAAARVNDQIRKAPENSAYYTLLGELLMRGKDFHGATDALQKAINLDKNNLNAFALLAHIQVAQGSVDKAIASYERLIQDNPQNVRAYVAPALLEESRGNWQKAQSLYQKALQIEPDFALAANNLAYLQLAHGGNTDVALALAQTARRGMPESPNTADTLAWAYYNKGVYSSAVDLLREALVKAPQNPTYHYHIGLAYEKMNETALARQHLARVLQIDPRFPQTMQIRELLEQIQGSRLPPP